MYKLGLGYLFCFSYYKYVRNYGGSTHTKLRENRLLNSVGGAHFSRICRLNVGIEQDWMILKYRQWLLLAGGFIGHLCLMCVLLDIL